jgi:hypothetical protein
MLGSNYYLRYYIRALSRILLSLSFKDFGRPFGLRTHVLTRLICFQHKLLCAQLIFIFHIVRLFSNAGSLKKRNPNLACHCALIARV